MKKIVHLLSLSLLSVVLVACGSNESNEANGEETKKEETSVNATEANDIGKEEETTSSDQGETMTKEENENTEAQVGDTITSEAGEQTMVSRKDDIGEFESGPITLTIDKVNGVSGTLEGEAAEFLERKEIEYIQVDMKVSNSSKENISFLASQAVLTTNTGEQLDPNIMMSEHIDGEFLGKINKKGTSIYILENSKAEEVNSVTLHYDGAMNEDFETIGDKLEIKVELKD